ncbi:ubiquitin-protein ligase E3A-like isoform X1 [Mizuhopecten yessoensis]|uniref:Ubiquitin-protein ligase E3A n=1 Tax=Mizuhopecten yessoensis TaxID=6573 RepID=A0A210QVX8_MIZYE|nr:ubiquitin-protein ligase E3A-like isoform X1 [Mizuhopecten yessoensis]OWF52883.1 Ubiquitin-protein ligase E3A [Mizuhopecten yessoensis]
MNSNEDNEEQSGNPTASKAPSSLSSNRPATGDGMKRALAKQLIEKYYYQLTDGCGNEGCENRCCASSSKFTFRERSRNELAVQAVEMFKGKATLCELQPSKVAKMPEDCEPSPSSSRGMAPLPEVTSATALLLPGPSASMNSLPLTMFRKLSPGSSSSTPEKEALSPVETKFFTEEILVQLIAECKEKNSWSKLVRLIGSTYNNTDSLLLSFRKTKETSVPKERDVDKDTDDKEDSLAGQEKMVIDESKEDTEEDELSIDIPSLRRAYAALMEIQDTPVKGALINALMSLARSVEMDLKHHKVMDRNPHYINIFIIVMEIPFMSSAEFIEGAFPQFCKAMGQLSLHGQARLAKVWSKFGADRLHEMAQALHQLITMRIVQSEARWGGGYYINDDDGITSATKVMKILFYASIYGSDRDSQDSVEEEKSQNEKTLQDMFQLQGAFSNEPKESRQPKEDSLGQELGVSPLDSRLPLIAYEDFVNEILNEYVDLEIDYKYKLENESKFSFMNHCFILTTASKQKCMNFDNRVRMYNERRTSIQQTVLFGIPPTPFLRLRVRRDHLIDDALVALEMTAMDNPQDLKKQLIVEFEGEQGLDEGGVSKEFFQLVIEELFNPDFGMFTYNEDTHFFWFNPTSFENDGQFTLIGIMLGLAIYNNTIVDVHFPPVVYRKLMGKKGMWADLKDIDPTMASSLKQMLEYQKEDFEDVFPQSFRIDYKDVFGSALTHDLKENGANIMVCQENKQEFADLYTDFILNKGIEKQFHAFKRGFHMVTNESPLRILFLPEEIELLICGSKQFDFHELEEATDYDGGFTVDSTTIKHFWEVVHSFSDEQKRKLVQFTTGTDRVPVGGLSKLKLIIARNGPDSDRLPTAHTCFNVLLLPDYSSKEKLNERLLKAINYSKGFGML